mgnify:CR=1 FL=1
MWLINGIWCLLPFFQQWMKENYSMLLIQKQEQIQAAHLAGQNSSYEDDGETEIEYYKNVYE